LAKISEKILDPFHEALNVLHVVDSGVYSATLRRAHGCASVTKILVFITLLPVLYARQRYTGKALLYFYGSYSHTNALQ